MHMVFDRNFANIRALTVNLAYVDCHFAGREMFTLPFNLRNLFV